MKTVLLFVLSFYFFSCDVLNKAANNNESLTYSLDINGCQTGSHSFSSLDAYCAGLQNNSLNNNCAQSSRQSLFNEKCSGVFTPSKMNHVFNVLDF